MRFPIAGWLVGMFITLSLTVALRGEDVRVTAIDPPKPSVAATAMKGLFIYISFEDEVVGYRDWENANQRRAKGENDRVIPQGTVLGFPLAKLPIPPDGLILVRYLGQDEWYGASLYVGSKNAKATPSVAFMDLDKIIAFTKSNRVSEAVSQEDLASDQGLVNFAMKRINERFEGAFGSVLGVHLLKNEKLPLVCVSVLDERSRPQDVSDLVLSMLSGDLK